MFRLLGRAQWGRVFMVLSALLFVSGALLGAGGARADGIVPCTQPVKIETSSSEICYFYECNVCDLQRLGMNILGFLIGLGMVIAALLFCYAGWLYVTAGPKPGNVSKAHNIFLDTLMGLIILLAAYLLVDVVMKSLYAENPKWGPWQEMLCKGEKDKYCVPKMKPIEAVLTLANDGSLTCGQQGGTCMNPSWCTNPDPAMSRPPAPGSRVVDGTDCDKDETYAEGTNKCCVPPGGGDTCQLSDGTNGTCRTTEVCTGTHEKSTCQGPFVCCAQMFPTSNYCLNASRVFPGADPVLASCICQTESGGQIAIGSGTDRCEPGKEIVSWGLYQINLTTENLRSTSTNRLCREAFDRQYTSSNHNCRVTDSALYEDCIKVAQNPEINQEYASGLYASRGFAPWCCSLYKCKTGANSCTGVTRDWCLSNAR